MQLVSRIHTYFFFNTFLFLLGVTNIEFNDETRYQSSKRNPSHF